MVFCSTGSRFDMVTSIFQPGIEVRYLHSHIINQDIQLYIKLPWSYDRGDTTYPVLFSLDENRSFPLYSTMSLIYETPGTRTKEIIIVGVGYKVDSDRIRGLAEWAAWRTRDLTPERSEETEQFWKEKLSALLEGETLDVQSGGAPVFLKSLREELIPFIEANYRVSSTDRGLAGYSYGGLFTLYALFHGPEMFTRYFAGGPTMWDQLFEYEQNYASTHNDLIARLFITAGGRESDLLEPMQRMVDRLRSHGYPGLEIITHVFEGEGHESAYAASVSRALSVLYYEDWLNG
jgi:predicted alpha/beta superfamily hydrolase